MYLGGGSPLSIVTQPGDATVQEGEDVSFSVAAEGGAQPYGYQWQVYNPKTGKWVNMEGCTEATVSRRKIEKKWNGAKFRCVVTDATGARVVSREATLTVRDKIPTGDSSNLPLYLAVALAALILLALLNRRMRKAQ